MDRTTNAPPVIDLTGDNDIHDIDPENMKEWTLADLAPDQRLVILRDKTKIFTTPRELMRQGRMPRFLTLDQVVFAFSTDDEPKEMGAVVSMWSQRVNRGR